METIQFTPTVTASKSLPFQHIVILPIGDVQLGARGVSLDRFKRYVEWGKEHDAYYIGMGDYVDVASPSGRTKIKDADLYDSVMDALESAADEAVRQFLKIMSGTEGRWLGLLEGHHYYDFSDATTSDTRIAEALKAPFLGTCAIVHLVFERMPSRRAVNIWCHHGVGGGMTAGAPINKIEKMAAAFHADLYLMGHTTRRGKGEVDYTYYEPHDGKLHHVAKKLINTGGWMAGYQQGSMTGKRAGGSYVEKRMMVPASLGGTKIWMKPTHREHSDEIEISEES